MPYCRYDCDAMTLFMFPLMIVPAFCVEAAKERNWRGNCSAQLLGLNYSSELGGFTIETPDVHKTNKTMMTILTRPSYLASCRSSHRFRTSYDVWKGRALNAEKASPCRSDLYPELYAGSIELRASAATRGMRASCGPLVRPSSSTAQAIRGAVGLIACADTAPEPDPLTCGQEMRRRWG